MTDQLSPEDLELLDELVSSRVPILQEYGFATAFAADLISVAAMLDRAGGASARSFWKQAPRDIAGVGQMRDEAQIVGCAYYLVAALLLRSTPVHVYQHHFVEAFGYLAKSMLESARSIDLLASSGCYIDGLSIGRTICGRLNLLMLFAANPALFDDWLRNPTDEKYLDGRIRDVLDGHGLEFHGQLYDELSEAIHLHETILDEHEDHERSLFQESANMQFRLHALSKLLLGRAIYVGLAMYRQDLQGRSLPPEGAAWIAAWPVLEELVAHNRIEHLFSVTLAPESPRAQDG